LEGNSQSWLADKFGYEVFKILLDHGRSLRKFLHFSNHILQAFEVSIESKHVEEEFLELLQPKDIRNLCFFVIALNFAV
jgi:hypothetical protein